MACAMGDGAVSFQTDASVGWPTQEEGAISNRGGRVGYLGPKRRGGLRLEYLQEVLDDVLGLLPEQHAVVRRALDQMVRGILAITDRCHHRHRRVRGDRRRAWRVGVPSSKDFSSVFWCVSLA
jgi:hypothetical protein